MRPATETSTSLPAYNVNLQTDPPSPLAGEPVQLSFVVTEQPIGDPLAEFELVHGRLMHLVLVSDDLAFFDHVHPSLRDGVFRIAYTFPEAGMYRLWVDSTPKGGKRCLAAFRVQVGGRPVHQFKALVADPVPVMGVVDKGYRVSLDASGKLKAGRSIVFTFTLADAEGKPMTDLEPLMGAGGHCVIVREGAREFIHVHPTEIVNQEWRGGPEIAFDATFPSPGLYKMWGQFLHQKKLITVAFVLRIV